MGQARTRTSRPPSGAIRPRAADGLWSRHSSAERRDVVFWRKCRGARSLGFQDAGAVSLRGVEHSRRSSRLAGCDHLRWRRCRRSRSAEGGVGCAVTFSWQPVVEPTLMAAGIVDLVQVTIFPVITGQSGVDPIFGDAKDPPSSPAQNSPFPPGPRPHRLARNRHSPPVSLSLLLLSTASPTGFALGTVVPLFIH